MKTNRSGRFLNLNGPMLLLAVFFAHLMLIMAAVTGLAEHRSTGLVVEPARPDAVENTRDIIVLVHADHSITLDGRVFREAEIAPRLKNIFSTRGPYRVFITADDGLEFGGVVQIIDIVKGAGVDRVSIGRFR